MSHEKIISEIKESCRAKSLPTEYLEELVLEYDRACETVNQRLGDINRLVVNGHKSAAVQLAEESPNVLEQLAALDFPERVDWCDLLISEGVNPPIDLAINHAETLEKTYSELRRLEPLLIKHRLLALSQAPLKARIQIIKQLADQEPTNVYWQEDLESYEQARLSQLDGEYLKAKAKGDYDRLSLLKKEVVENSWSVPVPKQLKTAISKTTEKVGRNDAVSKMSVLSEKLNDAYAEYDDASARKTRIQWEELNSVAMLEADHEAYQQVEEVFSWLDELENERATEDAYQTSLFELERAVDKSLPLEELDRKIYDAQKFEREIPEVLAHRVNQYREQIEYSARRKIFWRNALVFVVGLMIASIVGWVSILRANAARLTDARSSLQHFLDKDEFPAGIEFGDSLPEWIGSDAEVISLRQKLIEGKDNEAQRINDFKEWEDGFEISAETEDLGTQFDNRIEDGRKLAKSEKEKETVALKQRQLDIERTKRLDSRNQIFQEHLSENESALDELRNTDFKEIPTQKRLEELIATLKDATVNAREREDGKEFVSSTNRNHADRLLKDSRNLKVEKMALVGAAVQLTEIRRVLQLGKNGIFSDQLDRFSKNFAANENSTDFKTSASEERHWRILLELSQVIGNAKERGLTSHSPDKAIAILKKLGTLFVSVDCEADCEPLVSALEAIDDTDVAPVDLLRFKEEMDRHKFSKTEVLDLDLNGVAKFYYLEKPINLNPRDKFYDYYKDDESTKSTKTKLPAGKLSTGVAPHTIVSNKILSLLEKSQNETPENLSLAIVEFALREPQKGELALDHAAHARIVWLTIDDYARKLAPRFEGFWNKARRQLQNGNLHEIDFKDIDAKNYGQLRNDCKNKLKKIRQEFAAFHEELKKQNEFSSCEQYLDLKICGWILKENGKWKFDSVIDELNDTPLFCLQVTEDKSKLQEIGQLKQGKFVPKSEELLQAGRPVFARILNDR